MVPLKLLFNGTVCQNREEEKDVLNNTLKIILNMSSLSFMLHINLEYAEGEAIYLGQVPAYYIQFLFNGCHCTSWYANFAQCLVNVSEMHIWNQEDL